jgi:hypothetical protein
VIVEKLVEWRLAGETEVLGENPSATLSNVSFLLGLILYPEDGGDYTMLYCRRHFIATVVAISYPTTKE